MKRRAKLVRVIPLNRFVEENLGLSRATGKRRRKTDPDFPPLLLISANQYGVREDDAAAYQEILQQRAETAKLRPELAKRAKEGGAKSAAVRRAKAAA